MDYFLSQNLHICILIPKFAANKFYQNENINSNDFDAVNLYTSKVGSTYSTSTDGGGHYLDPSDEKPKNERAPMVPIYFDQDGHTFTFNSSLVGETVEVVIDDEVLYTTVVGEDGIVVVPEFISGEVELRLYRGSLVYQVTVEL